MAATFSKPASLFDEIAICRLHKWQTRVGSPAVRKATLTFGAPYAPAKLEIKVENCHPDNWRVKRVTLNGVELTNWRVRHADLVKGGELVFEMADRTEP